MSKEPFFWLDKIDIDIDDIFIHLDISSSELEKIQNKNYGIVINHNAKIEDI